MAQPLRSRRREPVFTTQLYFDALEESIVEARAQVRACETTMHLALLRMGSALTELDSLRAHLNRHGHVAQLREEDADERH